MCKVSDSVERVDIMSVVDAVRERREDVFCRFGAGRASIRRGKRGSKASISVGEGGRARGERRVDVSEVRVRVVCARWVVREVCAVIRLGLGVSMPTRVLWVWDSSTVMPRSLRLLGCRDL